MLVGDPDRLPMAARQSLRFAVSSAAINRPYRMNYVFCRKPPASRHDCLSGRKSSNLADDRAAFRENRRPPGVVNRAIDAPTAEQRRIGRVHNSISRFFSDIRRAMNLDALAFANQEPHKAYSEYKRVFPISTALSYRGGRFVLAEGSLYLTAAPAAHATAWILRIAQDDMQATNANVRALPTFLLLLFRQRLHARQFPALEEFQRRPAARGNVRNLIGDVCRVHRRHRIAAADD